MTESWHSSNHTVETEFSVAWWLLIAALLSPFDDPFIVAYLGQDC